MDTGAGCKMVHFLIVLLCSVVFSVSSLALCSAMQAVDGILLEQDVVSRWAPSVAIVSKAWYHTWRGVTVGRWAQKSAIRRPREHADLAHRLCSAAWQHAPEAPSPRDQWRRRLSQLIDAMDRGVVELGPAPPAPLMASQQQLLSGARHMCDPK